LHKPLLQNWTYLGGDTIKEHQTHLQYMLLCNRLAKVTRWWPIYAELCHRYAQTGER
jgi:hypothetical protein